MDFSDFNLFFICKLHNNMTIDNSSIVNEPYVPSYVPTAPQVMPQDSYIPQQSYEQPGYTNQTTMVVRTQRTAGSGLTLLAIIVWCISFIFLYSDGIFWTLQIISYCLCFFGIFISLASRRNRTYVITTEPQYSYPQSDGIPQANYPPPPPNPAYV